MNSPNSSSIARDNAPTAMNAHSTSRLILNAVIVGVTAFVVAICVSGCNTMTPVFAQVSLPPLVQVPTGHKVVLETTGVGQISYECRDKVNAPGQAEWALVGPTALLNDRSGRQVGKYHGPPATWEASDGSKVTGTQVATAPTNPTALPYQLVKANPATGNGAMTGVTYIQRVAIQGGIAPADAPCTMATRGSKRMVKYQADYIFWKAI